MRTGVARALWVSLLCLLSGCAILSRGTPAKNTEAEAVYALASAWVNTVATRDPGMVELVRKSDLAYYESLRDAALEAGPAALRELHPTDQLQVLFLRTAFSPEDLAAMRGRDLLLLAVLRGWIGVDLRRTDTLQEIVVDGDTATGRLYKFGRADRPDRGLQYFVREGVRWRVDLRGERERLRSDFAAFVSRSGLSASEAAFFILEARLARKVTLADFVPPSSAGRTGTRGADVRMRAAQPEPLQWRVVALRESLEAPELRAVTLEERCESLRYVVRKGERFGANGVYRVDELLGDGVSVAAGTHSLVLRFEPDGPPLGQRCVTAHRRAAPADLFEVARVGAERDGLMAQWRNIGLRERPQLLQQATLTPERPEPSAAISGLRVRMVVRGSFWDQIGLEEGDLLKQVNGRRVDSLAAWRDVLRVAEKEVDISVTVRRGDRRLSFRTRTVQPRRAGESS